MGGAPAVDDLSIKIFADGADLDGILELAADPRITGYTTNPTLMRKAGITDYVAFAKQVVGSITEEPISFEVFADDFESMEAQAHTINSWADNIYVKIPVTNTKGQSACPLIARLSAAGVKLNVTAIMTPEQVHDVADALDPATPAIVSIFAGRVADTGRDPIPMMQECLEILKARPKAELLWASPRELLNIFQADAIGCHIITVTHDVLKKLSGVGKDLDRFSLETVEMFYNDASAAGYDIPGVSEAAE
jgi:transaldolase